MGTVTESAKSKSFLGEGLHFGFKGLLVCKFDRVCWGANRQLATARARLSKTMSKFLNLKELLSERERLHAGGRRLVLTNGVFDLLHVGHIRYLERARSFGDALVVALNSDRSVQELKGSGRPVTSQNERAEILAALRSVTFVTIFDDVSPRSLIAKVLPDVLVKGGDYSPDQIHGREEVELAGGQVVSLPFVEGVSTSSIIGRMKGQKPT